MVNPLHLFRDVNALRTVWRALVASDAMAGLAELRHAAVVTDKESAASAAVVLVLTVTGHIPLVDTFVVMQQDGGYVYPVWAGHTILAVVAGDGLVLHHQGCRLLQEGKFVIRQRMQGRIGAQVVLQMLHISHTAENSQHTGKTSGKAERPRCHALPGFALFQLCDDVVVYFGEPSAQQRFHNDGGDVPLRQFAVEVFGIDVDARCVPPVKVVL